MAFRCTPPTKDPVATLAYRPWELAIKPFQVAPQTWYVAGQTWVGCYLIDTGDGLILIDTAIAESAYMLVDSIYRLGYRPEQIKKILISHAHFDHCGAAAIMKKLTGAGDSESDMVKHVKNFYGVTDEQAASYLSDFKAAAGAPTDSEAMNILKAQRFVKHADAEEIADEYERLSQKAPSKRTKADQAMLDELAPAYRQIAMRREYNQSKKWYEADTGKAFDDLMKDTDFNDFAGDLNVPLTAAVKKYVKLKGVQKEEQPAEKKNPPSSGSVKSAGESVAKDFYTREEVEAMTDAEKRENYETIKKSIPKWKV